MTEIEKKIPVNILKKFNDLKIATKLVGGFGIVLFLIMGVISIYHLTVQSTTKNFKALMEVNVLLSDQAAEIKTLMKQCRIDEKNFLSTQEKKYLKQLDVNILSLKNKTQEIFVMCDLAKSEKTRGIAFKIAGHVETYSENFKNLVISYEKRGLDAYSGLRKIFASVEKQFILEMSYVDVEDLYVHMLKIIQKQNALTLTKDLEYQTELVKIVAEYDQVIAKAETAEVPTKDGIRDIIAEYRQILKKMLSAQTWELKRKHLGDMLEIIEEIDGFLTLSYLPNAKGLVLRVRSSVKDYLLFGGEKYIKIVHENISILYKDLTNSTVGEDLLVDSQKIINKYKKAFDNLVSEDKQIDSLYLLMSTAVNAIEESVERLSNTSKKLASSTTQKVNSQAVKQSGIALTIGFLSILLGFVLAFFITRQITRPIVMAVAFSRKMSKGDFTSRLDIHQKDEIGILANALNDIVTNLGDIFRDISSDVYVLSSSSENLRSLSEQMAKSSEDTALKSNTVASAAEEMNSNLNSVAVAMEETSVNLNSVAAATEENTSTIGQIAVNSEQAKIISNEAVAQAKNASQDMEKLGNAANDIGTVTETITKISEQTNLLALNATIEAARAGDAGKGFAVVANEIKELAQQTAEATKKIKSQITGIQDTTSSTIIGIEEISKIIDEVNEIISGIATTIGEQSSATQEIGGNIAQASQGIQEVNENIAQCSSVSNDITQDISGVNLEASEMSGISSTLNISAEDLTNLSKKLKNMIGQFEV